MVKDFTQLARSGRKHTPKNSGIFSNSGEGQKNDRKAKPSPSSGPAKAGSRADTGALDYALSSRSSNKKPGRSSNGKSAKAVAKYAK